MTARPPSLLRRIALRLTIVTLAAILLGYGWVFYQIRLATDRVSEGSLIAQAQEIASALGTEQDRVSFTLPRPLIEPQIDQAGLFRYAVTDEGGKPLYRSSWPTADPAKLQIIDRKRQLYEIYHREPTAELFFGAVLHPHLDGRTLTVQVERHSRHLETLMDTVLEEFFIHGAWVGLPFLASLLLISIWTIRGAIAPLKQLSRQAATIGPSSANIRLSEHGLPREIVPLVRAMNSALARLEAGYRMQRDFTADAAHELRTPLAVLRSHIDTLADRKLARSLGEDVDVMARVVSQLLNDARLDALAIGPAETADLSEIAMAVALNLAPLAAAKGKSVEAGIDPAPCLVRGNRESIYHAVRNLADNALRHTAAGSAVELTVSPDRVVRVADHGPGIPASLRETVFKRFWRSDRSDSGAGLGLAIVRKTMELHGGSVEIGDTPGGGATIGLRFPPSFAATSTASDLRRAAE